MLAFPLTWLLLPRLGDGYFLLFVAACFALGVWACGITGRTLGIADYGGIVWDEVVAFMLVLFFVPESKLQQAMAFLLFRFFDIVKPPPARYVDSHWKSGLGVMSDDLIAACYTIFVLALWQRIT